MEIQTICPNCKRTYTLDSQYEGSEAECETCHAIFTVARNDAKPSKTHKVQLSHSSSKENLSPSSERLAKISQNYDALYSTSIGSSFKVYDVLLILTGIKIFAMIVSLIKLCDTHTPAILVLESILELSWLISFLVFVFKKSK